ncbi:MAG: hypothetical protein AB7L66_18665 [Gemmatimonadales bacterium]
MAGVFLLYIPRGNHEALVHYEDTIRNKVALERVFSHVSRELRASLTSVFGSAPVAVWGSSAGPKNRSNFEQMRRGDDVLIVEGDTIKLIGKVAAKVESLALSRELWRPLGSRKNSSWELIYFLANPRPLDVPFEEFCRLFRYSESYQLRGFTTVAADRLAEFYGRYDYLYDILIKLERGERIVERTNELAGLPDQAPESLVEVSAEEIDEALRIGTLSDHVRMQWKLARLGRKAGERVWVPVGDRAKLEKAFAFDDYDAEFASGIDLPHSYLENIDVVWKQEFRIGAAYEIENTTAIYSGLLRFADLNIVAPNTVYPMFIVAPREKKARLRDQLRRPAFRRLELDRKVRFLSYEAIEEIDTFFAESNRGLNVDVVMARSEQAA